MKSFLDLLVLHVNRVIIALGVVCTMVVLADLFYDKGGHYGWEQWVGFQAAYGFVSCVGLVLAATQLRKLIMRSEDYYGDADDQYENASGEPFRDEEGQP